MATNPTATSTSCPITARPGCRPPSSSARNECRNTHTDAASIVTKPPATTGTPARPWDAVASAHANATADASTTRAEKTPAPRGHDRSSRTAPPSRLMRGLWHRSDDVGSAHPRLVGLPVGGRALRLPLGLDPAQVVVDLVVEPDVVPAQLAGHQLRHRPRRPGAAVEGLDRDPGTSGEHVVEVPGALVGDGVHHLGGEVVLGAGER